MRDTPRVVVVGASSPFVPDKLTLGIERLRACGFDVDAASVAGALLGSHAYLNGDDDERLAQLQAAVDSDADVVWLARGGYGLTRIVDRLVLPKRLPLFVGFSDVTALFAKLHIGGRLTRGVHGPLATSIATEPSDSVVHVDSVVRGGAGLPLPRVSVVRDRGDVDAPLFAANLCVLAALCGTPLQPDLSGHLVVLEEIGERPYRLDRMLTQLLQAGVFDGVAGVVVGHLTGCSEPPPASSPASSSSSAARDAAPSPLAVFVERLAPLGVTIAAGLPVGHEAPNWALPLGRSARLAIGGDGDGDEGTLTLGSSSDDEA